jgi:hypothetical protein
MLQLWKSWVLCHGVPPVEIGQLTTYSKTCGESTKGPTKRLKPQSGCANYTTVEEIPTGEEVLVGMFFLNECPIIILFDSRASHGFMSSACAKRAVLALVASGCHM